jgi:hypothetical protein
MKTRILKRKHNSKKYSKLIKKNKKRSLLKNKGQVGGAGFSFRGPLKSLKVGPRIMPLHLNILKPNEYSPILKTIVTQINLLKTELISKKTIYMPPFIQHKIQFYFNDLEVKQKYINFMNDLDTICPSLDTRYIKELLGKLPLPEGSFKIFNASNTLIQVYYKGLTIDIKPSLLSVPEMQFFIDNKRNIHILEQTGQYENCFRINNHETITLKDDANSKSDNRFKSIYEDETTFTPYEKHLTCFKNRTDDKYHTFGIKVKNIGNNSEDILIENLSWVQNICDDLNEGRLKKQNNVTRLLPQYMKQSNLDYFFTLSQEQKKKEKVFTCFDLDVEPKYLIIEKNFNENGEEFLIIGYPHKDMKSYLKLYKENEDAFNQIYADDKLNFMLYMAQLHNFIFKSEQSKQINTENIEILKDEIYKFYGKKVYYDYILNFYKNLYKKAVNILIERKSLEKKHFTTILTSLFNNNNKNLNTNITNFVSIINKDTPYNKLNDEDDKIEFQKIFKEMNDGIDYNPNFEKEFAEIHKIFLNYLGEKYLNKPMMNIKYVFLILTKDTNNNYVPAFFNLRELKIKHLQVLERLQEIIYTVLPTIFGIISENDAYKLWFSYVTNGEFCSFETRYIQTMSNTQIPTYKLKNIILLSVLIYMINIFGDNLYRLRIEHTQNLYKFISYNYFEAELEKKQTQTQKQTQKPKIKIETITKQINNMQYNTPTITDFLTKNKNKILIMFIGPSKHYYIIYMNKNTKYIYFIHFRCRINKIYKKLVITYLTIFDNIITNFNINHKKEKTYFEVLDNLFYYECIEHREFNLKDYELLTQYNPLFCGKLIRLLKTPDLNIKDYFKIITENLEVSKFNETKIPNLYLYIPFLFLGKILSADEYITSKKQFDKTENKINFILLPTIYTNKVIKWYNDIKNNELPIKQIIFNVKNTGYTVCILEEPNKNIVWVFPDNISQEEQIIPETYLSNIFDLKIKHLELLEYINSELSKDFKDSKGNTRKGYLNNGSITPSQACLHFQFIDNIIDEDNKDFFHKEIYISNFVKIFQQATRLSNMIALSEIINILTLAKQLCIEIMPKSNTYNDTFFYNEQCNKFEYFNKFNCDVIMYQAH